MTLLARIIVLVATAIALLGAASNDYVGSRSVTFDPASAAPFTSVVGSGFDCGSGWGPETLFGLEMSDLPDPPTKDEGVSVLFRSTSRASGGLLQGTFILPERPPADYYIYYLCALGPETRVYRAEPPERLFRLQPERPHPTAPPITSPDTGLLVAPIAAGGLLVMLIAASVLMLRLRITRRSGRMRR